MTGLVYNVLWHKITRLMILSFYTFVVSSECRELESELHFLQGHLSPLHQKIL